MDIAAVRLLDKANNLTQVD